MEIEEYGFSLFMDGDQWCAMLGHPMHDCMMEVPTGFGITKYDAICAMAREMV